ncbi:MAG: fibronectin type III domain-containing protein, partial [Flavobacteriaceae bacterium]
KNGVEKPSFPALVQPVDSIPPKAPVELTGTIDTTGVVHLHWKANTEPDLAGYRIFRSNNPDAEFNQLTLSPQRENTFTDTIGIRNLNPKIYYKVLAEDQRYNPSGFSEMLALEKPDLIPPSPPVISEYTATENGVNLSWTPSSADDVVEHTVYRKKLGGNETQWELVKAILSEDSISHYLDSQLLPGTTYAYTVVAKDRTGWESNPSGQIVVKTPKKLYAELIPRFNAIVDREQRSIRLDWKANSDTISEFLLYRAEGDAPLALYKTIKGDNTSYVDTHLVVSTKYRYAIQLVEKDGTQSQLKKVEVTY